MKKSIIPGIMLFIFGMIAGKIAYNFLNIRNAALITLAAFLICILIFDTITESKRRTINRREGK